MPDSCCKTVSLGCGSRDHPSNIHYTGCRHPLGRELGRHLAWLTAASLAIALLQARQRITLQQFCLIIQLYCIQIFLYFYVCLKNLAIASNHLDKTIALYSYGVEYFG